MSIEENLPKNWYKLTSSEKKKFIGKSKDRKLIYNYFKLYIKDTYKITEDDLKYKDNILFSILDSTNMEISTKLKTNEINGQKVLNSFLKSKGTNKEIFVKICTFLFLNNQILISPTISGHDATKDNFKNGFGLPNRVQCNNFMAGMEEILQGEDKGIIYLTSYGIKEQSKITISKIKELENQIDAYKTDIKELTDKANKTVDNLKGQIITIVGLLVSIVPLVTTNLSLLNTADISTVNVLLSNGVLISVIGLILSVINQFVDKKINFKWLLIVGAILILIAVACSEHEQIALIINNVVSK